MLIVLLGAFLVVTTLSIVVHLHSEFSREQRRVISDLELIGKMTNARLAQAVLNQDAEQISETLHEIADYSGVVSVYLLDRNGASLATAGSTADPANAEAPFDLERPVMHFDGAVQTHLGSLGIHGVEAAGVEAIRGDVVFLISGAMLQAMVLGLLFLLLFRRRLTQPLATLTEQIHSLNPDGPESGSDKAFRQVGRDEIGLLAQAVQQATSGNATRRPHGGAGDLHHHRGPERVSEGVFQATLAGELISANSALCAMFGEVSAEDALADGACVQNYFVDPGDTGRFLQQLQASGRVEGMELEMRRRDGSRFFGLLNARVSDEETDDEPRLEGSVRDVTTQKEREQAIQQCEAAQAANEAKSQFLAHISHEIRTPMNAIIGLTQLMEQTDLDPVQGDYLQKVQSSAKILLGIINDVLDFSKIEAGHLELERMPFELPRTMNDVAHLLEFQAREKGLELIFNQDIDIPKDLIGDPLRLGQVLINLGQNAVKFTEKGEIQVSSHLTERGDDWVRIRFSVRDTGIGMSEQQAARLFQPFTQVDSDMSRRVGGTGLGLAICRELVEAMGGEIRVDSQPGSGTTFDFDVRLGALPGEQGLQARAELMGRRILVVDDNQTALQTLTVMLVKLGFQVSACSSGEACIQALVAETEAGGPGYDALILDWWMPDMDGLETARRIQVDARIASRPPILMVTAFGRGKVLSADVQGSVDQVLTKPLYVTELYESLSKLILGDDSARQARAQASESAALIDEGLRGRRVLLAEDNQINREVAVEFLRQSGVEVDVAVDGQDAVNQAKDGAYDLVLMDIEMPVMDGLEATRRIRASGITSPPIIALTAHAWSEAREDSLSAGMDDHLSKPVDPRTLRRMLHKWIDTDARVDEAGVVSRAEADDRGPFTNDPDAEFEHPGLDLEGAITRACGNWELLRRMVDMFKQENGRIVDELRSLVGDGQLDDARKRVHTLKGQAGLLGAERVGAIAVQLEDIIRSGEDPRPALDRLDGALIEILAHPSSSD